mmetsp:Transcript_62752/g.152789  ORF Transcript_62752/g.152789 Transcript_62752/m.152789 type:complete len:161 (-) Transcript_62752:862-1344(-)
MIASDNNNTTMTKCINSTPPQTPSTCCISTSFDRSLSSSFSSTFLELDDASSIQEDDEKKKEKEGVKLAVANNRRHQQHTQISKVCTPKHSSKTKKTQRKIVDKKSKAFEQQDKKSTGRHDKNVSRANNHSSAKKEKDLQDGIDKLLGTSSSTSHKGLWQ